MHIMINNKTYNSSGQTVYQKPVGQLPRSWTKPHQTIETSPSVLEPGWAPQVNII